MEGMIELTLLAKAKSPVKINLNINHIVYIRRYHDKDKELTAVMTPGKMLVVAENLSKVQNLIENAKKIFTT